MTEQQTSSNSKAYSLTLVLFLVIGIVLRLWNWPSQHFLDDEWHHFGFVMNRTFSEVLFQHGMGANSIPVNIWFWLTLHTVGWSEVILRLPSMLTGISAMIVLPLLVKRLWGNTVSLIFAAMLAVSPVLIFYTRVDRPFSPAMLFGTTSVLMTLLWIREGRNRQIFLSVLLGFIGIYYHLYTSIPVGFPLIVTAVAAFTPVSRHLGLNVQKQKPWPVLWASAGIMLVLLGLFVVMPNVLNPWWAGYQGMSRANWRTLKTFTELLAGTGHYNLSLVTLILIPLGIFVLIARDRTQGITFAAPLAVFFAVIANYTQDGAHAGIQAARYGIAVIPLCFIAIAIALEWCAHTTSKIFPGINSNRLILAGLLTVWLPFLATSPLWEIYRSPNNFTSHSSYQYNYTPKTWVQSPERELSPGVSVAYTEIPSIYRTPETTSSYKGIIEYPVMIGDHFNLLYYYQRFHRLPVVAGYTKKDPMPRQPARAEWVFAGRTIDYIMTGLPAGLEDRARAWKSMVDVTDISFLRKHYPGWLIILHKNPLREVTEHIPETGNFAGSPDFPLTPGVSYVLSSAFGAPVQNNNHISAWKIP